MTRRFAATLAAIAAGLAVVAVGVAGAATPALKLKTDGQLLVGSDIPYAPFEFYSPPGSRTVVGFDVDLVKAAAKKLGISKVTFTPQPFDTIFVAVAQGRYDMVASSVSITPERAKRVLFSNPYFTADQSLMVKKGSSIKSTKDLAGKVIGAQTGTTGAELAKSFKPQTIKTYQLIDDAFQALAAGKVDAVVNDFSISKFATRSKKTLVVVQRIKTKEGYGLVFPKSSTGLRDAFNGALAAIKKDGTYVAIYKKWFGETPK